MIAFDLKDPGLPPPTSPFTLRDPHGVIYEIVHHAASGPDTTIQQIDRMHRSAPRNYIYVGYHIVIDRDGTAWEGRPLDAVPAATEGVNSSSVAICLIGQYEPAAAGYNGPVPAMQLQSLVRASIYVHQRFPSIAYTIGHREAGLTIAVPPYDDQCPGADVIGLLDGVRSAVHDWRQQ